MFVYLAVKADEYELPVAIADSVKELASLIGTTSAIISTSISKGINGKYTGIRYLKVEIDDEEEDNEWETF